MQLDENYMREEKIIRVVVDTNIWISFLIGRRLSNLMKLLTRADVQLIFSEELLNELHIVSKRPKFLKYFPSTVQSDRLIVYEIISTRHNHAVENFHVYYKNKELDKEPLLRFCKGFREKYCTKQANIYLYDINCDKLKALIDMYPLRGEDETYMAEHNIAASIMGCEDSIWLYPMK